MASIRYWNNRPSLIEMIVLQIAAKISIPNSEGGVPVEASAVKRPFEGSSGIVMQPEWTVQFCILTANPTGHGSLKGSLI